MSSVIYTVNVLCVQRGRHTGGGRDRDTEDTVMGHATCQPRMVAVVDQSCIDVR